MTPKELLDMLEFQGGKIIAGGEEHVPMLFCLKNRTDGVEGYDILQLAAVQMPEPEHREEMAKQLSELVEKYDGYVFATEGWVVKLPKTEGMTVNEAVDYAATIVRPSQHPQRIEVFMVNFVSKWGTYLSRTYEIVRVEGQPATLKLDVESTAPLAGIFGNLYDTVDKEQYGWGQGGRGQ